MVGDIGKNRTAIAYPETHRWPRVDHKPGINGKGPDMEPAVFHFMQAELAGQLPQLHREQGRRQISAEPCMQAVCFAGRSPDMNIIIGVEERNKKTETLNMIEVQVR